MNTAEIPAVVFDRSNRIVELSAIGKYPLQHRLYHLENQSQNQHLSQYEEGVL